MSLTREKALQHVAQAEGGSLKDLAEVLRGMLAVGRVAVGDANYTVKTEDSGKLHMIANVSADRTITLPAPVDGLVYEFIATVVAADGHDWIFDTGSNTNYFTGSIVHVDTDSDSAGDEIVVVAPDGNSNSKLQINVPQGGTKVRLVSDGTLWNVDGIAVSATAPAFADQ